MEGGWSDNPDDPGGATMEGITLDVYREFQNDPSLTGDDLKNIPDDVVAAIYQRDYWNATSCDDLHAGVDLMVFDMTVNSGSHGAKILQAVIGTDIDGVIGPITITAANRINAVKLINALAVQQSEFYRSLPSFIYFGKGWLTRVHARQAAALSMAADLLPIIPKTVIKSVKVTEAPPVGFYSLIGKL
jgi:lysozyme family protein